MYSIIWLRCVNTRYLCPSLVPGCNPIVIISSFSQCLVCESFFPPVVTASSGTKNLVIKLFGNLQSHRFLKPTERTDSEKSSRSSSALWRKIQESQSLSKLNQCSETRRGEDASCLSMRSVGGWLVTSSAGDGGASKQRYGHGPQVSEVEETTLHHRLVAVRTWMSHRCVRDGRLGSYIWKLLGDCSICQGTAGDTFCGT